MRPNSFLIFLQSNYIGLLMRFNAVLTLSLIYTQAVVESIIKFNFFHSQRQEKRQYIGASTWIALPLIREKHY
jgi:hypothetical protein